jgi:hypothetical protein
LIDVLPGEPSIALIVAHQLSHGLLNHRKVDLKFVYPDILRVGDDELLAKLRFRHSVEEEAAADEKALELLKHSPYKDKMSEGGLFISSVHDLSKQLQALIHPHFGEHVADEEGLVSMNAMFRTAPVHDPKRPGQVAALPLGSKLVVNPWDGSIAYFRPSSKFVPLPFGPSEFTVAPIVLDLGYFKELPSDPKPAQVAIKPRPAGRKTPATSQLAAPVVKPASLTMTTAKRN